MAERDASHADDPPDPRPERDPNALAAWRQVAEQRRRRTEESASAGRVGGSGPAGERDDATPPGPASGGGPDGGAADASARSRHDLLLAMAGRIDDDALGAVRELVPVDDAAAAELLGGCLLADRVAVTDRERVQLEHWFTDARVDPDLLEALPVDGEAPTRSRHRFLPDLPGAPVDDGESVARAAAQVPGVAHVRQCWRVTPAGGSPGPLPHRVVLVETDSPDDREHVARHVAHAAATLGAVSVEVYATGAPLPVYQRDAVTAARTLTGPDPAVPARPDAAPGLRPASPVSSGSPDASLPVRRRPGAGAALFAPLAARGAEVRSAPGDGAAGTSGRRAAPSDELAEVTDVPGHLDDPGPDERDDPQDVEDRRDTEGWRLVADADRGVAATGWSTSTPAGPEDPVATAREGEDADGAGRGPIADLDPDAAAARIAALWREPSAVDAFDVPLDPGAVGPNLLEPDLPEPDLARELARYDTPRPVTGSFERVEADPRPPRTTGRHGSGDEPDERPDGDERTGDDPALRSDPVPESGRIRRARHSRSGPDDDEPGRPADPAAPSPAPRVEPDPDATGAAARREEPPTGPVALGGTAGAGESTPPAGTGRADRGPDTDDAVSSQLSDRERDLLARLHAELAARERLESGEPDPFAAGADGPHRAGPGPAETPRHGPGPLDSPTSPSRRPSPSPRPPGGGTTGVAPTNGHHHGPVGGNDQRDEHGPCNGRTLGREGPGAGDEGP